jgi:hypothetical protein
MMKEKYYDSNGLVNSDWSEPAGLPQGFMKKEMPDYQEGMNDRPPMLYDAVKMQMQADAAKLRSLKTDRRS